MSDQRSKVLSFGPFELSIGNRLPTNGAKVVPLGARAMDLLGRALRRDKLEEGQRSRQAGRARTWSQEAHLP
jgi:hypothetical protein